jgi:hypothetical protein
MISNELNPNHGVTREVREQWHKLCALVLFKTGETQVQITADDIDRFANSGLANITVRPKDDTLTLALVSDKEAVRLAREEGGLPV